MARDHRCHALDCERPCAPRLLMCRDCWGRVSAETQALVCRLYRPGQEEGRASPSRAWLAAAVTARAVMAGGAA